MSAKYTLKVVADFAAAHTLRGYPGACSRMHGHNWKVEAEVIATELNEIGMAIDFKEIKQEVRAIAKQLDHHYLNDLNAFQEINPTAENIARYFYVELSRRLNKGDGKFDANRHPQVKVSSLTLWETERACVRYSED